MGDNEFPVTRDLQGKTGAFQETFKHCLQGFNGLTHESVSEKTCTQPQKTDSLSKLCAPSDSLVSIQKQACQADMSPFLQDRAAFIHPDKHTLHHAGSRALVFPHFKSATLWVLWGLITPAVHGSHAKEVALAMQGEISSSYAFYSGFLFPKEEHPRY